MKRHNLEFTLAWLDALHRRGLNALLAARDPAIVWQGQREDLPRHDSDRVVATFPAPSRLTGTVIGSLAGSPVLQSRDGESHVASLAKRPLDAARCAKRADHALGLHQLFDNAVVLVATEVLDVATRHLLHRQLVSLDSEDGAREVHSALHGP
jgi:hypothetical protein